MTENEIRCYELSYQIKKYLKSQHLSEKQFSELVKVPLHKILKLSEEPSLDFRFTEITRICDLLSISMDSIIFGPINEKAFITLLNKCDFAERHKNAWFYKLYNRYLMNWRSRNISDNTLKRYVAWVSFIGTPNGSYIWERIEKQKHSEVETGFKIAALAPGLVNPESPEDIERAKKRVESEKAGKKK